MVTSLSGILKADDIKLNDKKNKTTSPINSGEESIWANYFNKPNKQTTFVHKEESYFTKICSNIKNKINENRFTNAVMLFLHIKSDKRYQNLKPEEKQKLHELLKKYNFDIDNVDEAYEKINSYLKYHNAHSKTKPRDFSNAMTDAAKFSMKHNYNLLCQKDILADKIFNIIEKNLDDDNNLNLAMMEFFSDGMNGNEKAKFIEASAKNSVHVREEVFKSLHELIKKNPTTKENIEKLYEINKCSSLSLSDMVIKLLETTDCEDKLKTKIRETILKIKMGIPEEYEKHLDELKKSEAWIYILKTKEKMLKAVEKKIDYAERRVIHQEYRVENKTKDYNIEKRKLGDNKYKAKKMKKQADEIIEDVRMKCNLAIIPENHKDEVIKNNNALVYKRYKNSQEELKKSIAAEYEAESDLRLAKALLKIDKDERDFEIARYNCLLNCC